MDEFGSAIRHSDTPSFAMAPFYYIPKQLSFSVIWCLKDLEYGGSKIKKKAIGYQPFSKNFGHFWTLVKAFGHLIYLMNNLCKMATCEWLNMV